MLQAKALEGIKIVEGPFDNGFNNTIPSGCSFKISAKPDPEQGALQKTIMGDWDQLPDYMADGPGGMSYAIQSEQTVCFVNQEWDDPGDDATAAQLKKWKPKPDSIFVGCTDKKVFDQIDAQRKDPNPPAGRN
jgi:hypothetical protein